MTEAQKGLEYTLRELQSKYVLTDNEVDLIRMLCMYETNLNEIENTMSEFEFYKLMRGFKNNYSKGMLLEDVTNIINSIERDKTKIRLINNILK